MSTDNAAEFTLEDGKNAALWIASAMIDNADPDALKDRIIRYIIVGNDDPRAVLELVLGACWWVATLIAAQAEEAGADPATVAHGLITAWEAEQIVEEEATRAR